MAANTGNRDNRGANNGRAIAKERESLQMVPGGRITVAVTAETRRKRAFTALAMAGGNRAEAGRAVGMDPANIAKYLERWPEEYEQVRRDLAPDIEAAVVEEMRAFIVAAGAVKSKALEQIDRALDEGTIPARDLHQTLRNVAASQSTAVDKTLSLSGRPERVVEHRSASELIDKLTKLGALKRPEHIDGTAVDVSDSAPALPVDDAVDVADVDAVPDG